jgi:CubicO group peptidase (beta-lactamase class C family)
MKIRFFLLNLLIINWLVAFSQTQNLYFPPLTGNVWETKPPAELNWCQPKIDELYQFLEDRDTKGFVILKDGKIVLEKYFGTFTQDSIWYWASAGKSLTATLVGLAKQQNLLALDQKTSDFLGTGWTSCTPAQEEKITIRHQLAMTTGLNESPQNTGSSDPTNCTDAVCLQYLTEPGTRWAYHTGAYRLLQNVVAKASNSLNINQFCKNQLFDKIGAKGAFVNDVFYSRTRDAARFGLFLNAKGAWNGQQIMTDSAFFKEMIAPSQTFNKSYGYLFWLNGQSGYMLPGPQFEFPGQLFPDAPADMYSCLGKNDQKIHVVPSQNLVIVRLGNAADPALVAINFDNELWKKINELDCIVSSQNVDNQPVMTIFPNPTTDFFYLNNEFESVEIFSREGRFLRKFAEGENLTVADLPGQFFGIKIIGKDKTVVFQKLVRF